VMAPAAVIARQSGWETVAPDLPGYGLTAVPPDRLVEEGPCAFLRVTRESEAPAPASHELRFALLVQHARRMVSGFSVVEARFAHRVGPVRDERLQAFFLAPVVFDTRYTELVLDAALLAAPLAEADADLLAVLLPTAEQRRRLATPTVTERVGGALHGALSTDDAQLDRVSRRLGKTARSLQRVLNEEGTSFQTPPRDEVRQELSDRYIRQGLPLA
jgi:AraC-like DNA-binding protein